MEWKTIPATPGASSGDNFKVKVPTPRVPARLRMPCVIKIGPSLASSEMETDTLPVSESDDPGKGKKSGKNIITKNRVPHLLIPPVVVPPSKVLKVKISPKKHSPGRKRPPPSTQTPEPAQNADESSTTTDQEMPKNPPRRSPRKKP